MSSATESLSNPSWCQHKRNHQDSKWTCKNIFFMVLGFILFWPVGVVLLFWILSGRDVRDLPGAAKQQFSKLKGQCKQEGNVVMSDDTNNAVFNEYQQTQYDRISEIKAEIKDREKRFREFRADAQRRADQQEFDAFMAHNPSTPKES